MVQRYDIIIVGGGIAGTALACALAPTGLRIALLEAGTVPARQPPQSDSVAGFDPRVSALTAQSEAFLQEIHAWPLLQPQAQAYQHMHVWDAEGTGTIDFDIDMVRQPRLGHIVENRVTVWALYQCLQQTQVQIFAPARLAGLQYCAATAKAEAGYQLQLEDGQQLHAGLVVAADGALSTVRRLAGIDSHERSYQHTAIVATVQTEHSHQNTAWQRFLPQGPLAFLPLRDAAAGQRFCSIVWSAEPGYAADLLAMDDAQFGAALGTAIEQRLGPVKAVSKRASFPLLARHANEYYRPGLALVGDAAHTIHPLAGQGINLGLKDVAVLAQEIKRAVARQLAPGDSLVLARYQRRRRADNLAMAALMDGFKQLFGRRELPLRWLRNSGMRLLNQHPQIKAQLIKQAMGL